MKYIADNGKVVIARDELQAAAFENAGLKLMEEPTRKPRQPKE